MEKLLITNSNFILTKKKQDQLFSIGFLFISLLYNALFIDQLSNSTLITLFNFSLIVIFSIKLLKTTTETKDDVLDAVFSSFCVGK